MIWFDIEKFGNKRRVMKNGKGQGWSITASLQQQLVGDVIIISAGAEAGGAYYQLYSLW